MQIMRAERAVRVKVRKDAAGWTLGRKILS